MVEKMNKVSNPLTVIAIFAGLSEISGTVVLPLLIKDNQSRFLWFVMGFPCLLIVLFFIVLWFKHRVLYAPSDYKNDSSFLDAAKITMTNNSINSQPQNASTAIQY